MLFKWNSVYKYYFWIDLKDLIFRSWFQNKHKICHKFESKIYKYFIAKTYLRQNLISKQDKYKILIQFSWNKTLSDAFYTLNGK